MRFGEVDPRYKHPAWERCSQVQMCEDLIYGIVSQVVTHNPTGFHQVKKVPASKLLLSDQRVQLVGEDRWD